MCTFSLTFFPGFAAGAGADAAAKKLPDEQNEDISICFDRSVFMIAMSYSPNQFPVEKFTLLKIYLCEHSLFCVSCPGVS